MAIYSARLSDLVEEALVEYLEDTHRSQESSSSNFGYDPDSSNLRISLHTKEPFDLTLTEVSASPCSPWIGLIIAW